MCQIEIKRLHPDDEMDYLMFKPYDLLNEKVVIPPNRDLGNCIFASVPNHSFYSI